MPNSKFNEHFEDHRVLSEWSEANETLLPIDMRFNDGHKLSITVYSVLMVFSAVGNVTVLILLLKRKSKQPSRINTMLIHLAIADLLVTFLMMPLEIAWAATVQWKGGDLLCRVMAFFRMFGLYLSSFILMCISLDRYYAIIKPLDFAGAERICKRMLIVAWGGAVLCSFPQSVVFHVEAHPNVTDYYQCITYNVFPTETHELVYLNFSMVMMYALPLIIIIYSYASILLEIFRKTRNSGPDSLRRSSLGYLGKAKIRTLKMTVIIVLVFIICWTPYWFMSMWYWYDRDTAKILDQRIQRGLFLFACTNSCMNPIVYGVFNIRKRRMANQSTEVNHSRNTMSTDVVCLGSWRKSNLTPCQSRRDMCLSCGESFECSSGVSRLCSVNGRGHRWRHLGFQECKPDLINTNTSL